MAEADTPLAYEIGADTDILHDIAPPTVLAVAGSDPSGGAGLQADLATIGAFGCHGAGAVTAITIQDTRDVHAFRTLPAEEVARQMRTVLADIPVAAVKVGMVGSPDNARAIADVLAEHPDIPAVVDPVLAAEGGGSLAEADLVTALHGTLMPRASLVAPNRPEAARIAGMEGPLEAVADELLREGAHYVLIKGGHAETTRADEPVTDRLFSFGREEANFSHPRLPNRGYHGSGCTLASAVATALAEGHDMVAAVRRGSEFTHRGLRAAYAPGQGQAVPNRLFHWRDWEASP